MRKRLSLIPLIFLFLVAFLGALMRLSPLQAIVLEYEHILHAHSHVAFQGWVYLAFFLIFVHLYIPQKIVEAKHYNLLFWGSVITTIGILFSFLWQGYALYSILFSSIFQLFNYWFAFRFLKDIKQHQDYSKHKISLKFAQAAILFMILSTIGPWAVGVISAKGYRDTEIFHSAIYYFLHFQYNGFFTLAAFSVLFQYLEKFKHQYNSLYAKRFYRLTIISVIPTYFVSLLVMSF